MKRPVTTTISILCAFCLLSAGILPMQQAGDPQDFKSTGSLTDVERGRPDPFAPLEKRADAPLAKWTPEKIMHAPREFDPEQLLLGGIVWSIKRPLAVVNQSLVGIDDSVAGWTVVAIERNKVVVEMEGRQKTLKMKSSLFDKQAGNSRASE